MQFIANSASLRGQGDSRRREASSKWGPGHSVSLEERGEARRKSSESLPSLPSPFSVWSSSTQNCYSLPSSCAWVCVRTCAHIHWARQTSTKTQQEISLNCAADNHWRMGQPETGLNYIAVVLLPWLFPSPLLPLDRREVDADGYGRLCHLHWIVHTPSEIRTGTEPSVAPTGEGESDTGKTGRRNERRELIWGIYSLLLSGKLAPFSSSH